MPSESWHDINDPGFFFPGLGKRETEEETFERLLKEPGISEEVAAFEREDEARLAQKGTSGGFALHSLSWRHVDEAKKGEKEVRNGDKIRLLCGVDGCADGTSVRFEIYSKGKSGATAQFQDASCTLQGETAAVEIALDLSKVKTQESYTVYFTVTARGKYSSNCTIPITADPLRVKKCEGPASAEVGTKVNYRVTELSRTASDAEAKKINWQVKVGDHIHRDEKSVGLTYELEIPGTHAGDVLRVHPYMNNPSNEIKVETKVGPFLKFDGSILALFDKEHKKIAEWPGVTGEDGETNPKQAKGPIPEGRWMVRQNEIQKLPGMFSGEPNWEGGEAAWGKERVQIYAYGAQTYGRARFYIHGGKKAGSKFGIDLTDKIDEFLAELRKLGKDVVMVVKLRKAEVAKEPAAKPAQQKSGYDIDKAVAYLIEKAEPPFGIGRCAKHVRLGLLAGGIDITPNPVSAKEYGPYLEKYGFKEVSKHSYTPIKGDVIVMQSFAGATNNHGHIQMYSGSAWVSDFVQPDLYPSSRYRQNDAEYKIYRWNIE